LHELSLGEFDQPPRRAGGQNYDTEADVTRHASEIDEAVAKGPDAANTFMPELGGTVSRKPSDAEREMLGAFLACVMN
jgi:hypothetical protein